MSQLKQLARALETTPASLYAAIAENIQLGLYVYRLDTEGETETLRLVYANPAAALLTGISIEESRGRAVEELFPNLAQTGVVKLFQDVARSGEPQTVPEFRYGDNRVAATVWSFKAFPLPDRCVGVAFESISQLKRAEDETRRQLDRLTALRNIDLAIIGSLDLKVTLQVLLDQVTTQLQVDAADILLYRPETRSLHFAVARGFRRLGIEHGPIRVDEGLPGKVARERTTIFVPDLRMDTDLLRKALIDGEGFTAYCGVPLISKGVFRGVLEVLHRTPLEVDADWMEFFGVLAGQAAIAVDNACLYEGLQRSNTELSLAYDRTLEGWAHALELRSLETEGHARRVTELTMVLAREAGICEDQLIHIRRGALLHDVGKIAIPDSILLKAGPLTDEEWEVMRKHPAYAYEMLSPVAFLGPALDIPYSHHERWDGGGYPRGLKAEQIPLPARIFAVVDAWDAMRSNRPYRDALPEEEALRRIQGGAGSQFDPEIAAMFVRKWQAGELNAARR